MIKITDPERKSIQYSYNLISQITQKVDKDGRTFSYVYQNGKPVAIKDGAGNTLFSLTNTQNWATNRITLVRDLMREYIPATTSKTDGRGNIWKYDYEKHGYITRQIAPDGATTTYTYDPATLKVASVTDPNGNTTSYEYDAMGNLIKMTDALGYVTTFTYEPTFNQITSVTDPNEQKTTYEYDAKGNRILETDSLGNTREWTYDSNGNVLTETDKNGVVTAYEYDVFGNLKKMTQDALDMRVVTLYEYDIVGNLISRTDANGHTTSFAYDRLDRLIKETDPIGGVTQTFYDGEGNRTKVIDRNGNITAFVYDLRQRLVQITDALNQIITYTYDGNDNLISITDKNKHTTKFGYDVQNRLIQTTDALGFTRSRTYDGVGNLLSETDQNGNTTKYQYDDLNRRILQMDALGNVTLFEYDAPGMPGCAPCTPTFGTSLISKQTDANGKVTYFKYDDLYRLTDIIRKEGDTEDVIDPSDAVTTYTYDPNGNRLSVTEPNGNTTTYAYDALNRLTKETNAAGDVTLYTYDGVGNVETITAPNGNITTNTYDANDRLIKVEDLIGLVATYTYDKEGNRLTQTDGNGNTTTFGYDALYRVISVIDPMGGTTQYQYDPEGNLLKVIDREGKITTHTYDYINRRQSTTNALNDTIKYTYDPVGNLKSITDGNGNPTAYDYDAVNRLIKETYADPIPNTRTFTYDGVGNALTRTDQKGQTTNYIYNDLYFLMGRDYPVSADDNFTYDLSGRMLTAERGGWLDTFTYDGANRVTNTTQNGQTIAYAYDIPGRTHTVTYPGGRTITEQTDLRGRLSQIDDAFSPPPIVQYTYDLGNRVASRTYRNGAVANYNYNANDWVLELEHSLGATRIVGFGHAYDKEGNKLFEEKRHDPAHSEAYQYDDIYRLIDYKVGQLVGSTVPAPITQTAYNLDPVGNWNSKTTDSVTETRTHNEANEIISINGVPIMHDDNGNLQEDETYIYAYDEENRLISATRKSDGQVVGQYQYDALGRRVVKWANPDGIITETRYFYDGWRELEEQDAAGVTQVTYVYGNYIDEVLTMNRDGQTYYYHQNTLYSVHALTNRAGNIVEGYQYDAYGRQTVFGPGRNGVVDWGGDDVITVGGVSAVGNPYMFTGRRLDQEAGLLYYRNRYLDTQYGRFVSRDPIGIWDVMVNLGNGYTYVGNNPINVTDPLGFQGRDPLGNPEQRSSQTVIEKGPRNCEEKPREWKCGEEFVTVGGAISSNTYFWFSSAKKAWRDGKESGLWAAAFAEAQRAAFARCNQITSWGKGYCPSAVHIRTCDWEVLAIGYMGVIRVAPDTYYRISLRKWEVWKCSGCYDPRDYPPMK